MERRRVEIRDTDVLQAVRQGVQASRDGHFPAVAREDGISQLGQKGGGWRGSRDTEGELVERDSQAYDQLQDFDEEDSGGREVTMPIRCRHDSRIVKKLDTDISGRYRSQATVSEAYQNKSRELNCQLPHLLGP